MTSFGTIMTENNSLQVAGVFLVSPRREQVGDRGDTESRKSRKRRGREWKRGSSGVVGGGAWFLKVWNSRGYRGGVGEEPLRRKLRKKSFSRLSVVDPLSSWSHLLSSGLVSSPFVSLQRLFNLCVVFAPMSTCDRAMSYWSWKQLSLTELSLRLAVAISSFDRFSRVVSAGRRKKKCAPWFHPNLIL